MTATTTRPPPYVGVSGITTEAEARAILSMWPARAPVRSLMLGVLTSAKVLGGGERNPRSAAPEDFTRIFQPDRRVLNLVHYFTKDQDTIEPHLLECLRTPACDGAQINVPWPSTEALSAVRLQSPDWTRLVLQVGPKMLTDFHYGVVAELVDREYRQIITDVLIDVSAGKGVAIDPKRAREMIEAVRAWNQDLAIGIAGGLCAETLPALAPLLRWQEVERGECDRCHNEPDIGGRTEQEIPVASLDDGWICQRCHARWIGPVSLDAEGRLRNERDELDLDRVRAYLDLAVRLQGWMRGLR